MMSTRALGLAAVVAAGVLKSAHGQPAPQPAAATPFTIVIEHYGFSPKNLVVPQGATITWVNRDGIRHDATAVGQWTTGTIMSGQSGSITATKAGTFQYKCTVHPDMHGTIVVEAPK
jgi:plastocyanin